MYSLAEGEQGRGILWDTVVRPHHKVELPDLAHWHLCLALTSNLGGREGGREGGTEGGREGREGGREWKRE